MSISVALAARNAERYIQPLLDSLARQTHRPLELVVCDDASDDATPALLSDFAASAPFPVRVVRDDRHRGHVDAFLHAARLCEGDNVAFCDADDLWLDHKLEVCARALESPSTTLVLHTTRVVDAQLREAGPNWPSIEATRTAPRLGLTGLDVDAPGMAMVFRRELLDAADFASRPPSRYGHGKQMLHDEWVVFLAGVLGEVHLIAEPLLLYRQHDSNDSGGWVRHERASTLRPAVGDYLRAAAHTGACADYLDGARARAPHLETLLAEGAREYRRTSESWALRASLYGAADRRSRARMMRRLLAARAYRPRTVGGFGRAALGKDLAAGLALRVVAGDER